MSFNQWKLVVQLKDTLSKISNDKPFQNVLNKDFLQIIQRFPTSVFDNENVSDQNQKNVKSNKDSSYHLPNVLESIRQKVGTTLYDTQPKDETPDWKKSRTISKSSIISRTNHVLSSIATAESDTSLLYRLESLTSHIRQYPQSRNYAVRKKGLTSQEIHGDMVGVLGNDAPSYQVVKNWSRQFKKTCKHAKSSGHPQTVCTQENVNRVCDLIKQDCWLTTIHLAEITGLSAGGSGALQPTLVNQLLTEQN